MKMGMESGGYNQCYPAETAQMEPLTSQLGMRIVENNAALQDLVARVYAVCEKVLGTEPKTLGSMDPTAKGLVEPVANGAMEKLIRDAKSTTTRLQELESLIRRLETL